MARHSLDPAPGAPLADGDTVLAPGESERFVDIYRRNWPTLPAPVAELPRATAEQGPARTGLHGRPDC